MINNVSSIFRTYPKINSTSSKLNNLPVFTGNDEFVPSRSKFLRTFDDVVRDVEKLNFLSVDATAYSDSDGIHSKQIGEKVQSGIASITKTFTSALVLKLQELNKLKINDKIVDYLPELKGKIPNIELITIKQLLNHSSGLPNYLDFTLFPESFNLLKKSLEENQIYTEYDYLSALKDCKVLCKPFHSNKYNGDSEHYSNTNYLLLGLLIKKATGKGLQEAFKQYLLEPLKLKDSRIGLEEHYWPSLKCSFADSGIISTSADVTNFIKALFVDKTYLSENSINQIKNEGLGIKCIDWKGQKVYLHGGEATWSFVSEFFFFPKDNKIVTVIGSYDKDKDHLEPGSMLKMEKVICSHILK